MESHQSDKNHSGFFDRSTFPSFLVVLTPALQLRPILPLVQPHHDQERVR